MRKPCASGAAGRIRMWWTANSRDSILQDLKSHPPWAARALGLGLRMEMRDHNLMVV